MNQRVMWSVWTVVAMVAAGGTAWHTMRVNLDVPTVDHPDPSFVAAPFSERAQRDVQLTVWHEALSADSMSALAMGQLAALYLQRAREGGPGDDVQRAEQLARRSLALRTTRNARSAVLLSSALMAQHRFPEALGVAQWLVAFEPDVPEYRALLGEAALEVGDDHTAASAFASVWTARRNISVAPRLARWLEVTNQVAKARRVLHDARKEAMTRRDITREAKAWFHLRVGDLELRAEAWHEANAAYRAGLAVEPSDPRLLQAMARLADAMGNHHAVIAWGERAIGAQMEPITLALVTRAYAALGQQDRAAEYDAALQAIATGQPMAFHRAWHLYQLDAGRDIDAIVAQAQSDLTTRKDVYGYDLAAWALYRAGDYAEARQLMAQALRFNTPDPLLAAHAKAIARAPAGGLPVVAARH